MPTVRLLAVSNLVAPAESADTLIVKGAYQDKQTLAWVEADNVAVPSGTVIAASSIFEAYLDDAHLGFWVSHGHAAEATTTRHFDLEQVFARGVVFLGDKMTLADVLRLHMIYTLEEVVENKPAHTIEGLSAQDEIPAQTILYQFGDERQVTRWLNEARAILGLAPVEEQGVEDEQLTSSFGE